MSAAAPKFDVLDNVPAELRRLPGWLLWRHEGERKVPSYVNGQRRAGAQGSPEDRAKLATFDQARARLCEGGYTGLGLAMLPDFGITALDFDDAVTDGDVNPKVMELVAGTYAEISPSGTGVRAFMLGDLTGRDLSKEGFAEHGFKFESYAQRQFVTVTGDTLDLLGGPESLCELTPAVREHAAARFADQGEHTSTPKAPHGYAIDDLRQMLEHISVKLPNHEWTNVLWAIQGSLDGATDPSVTQEALDDLANAWCATDTRPGQYQGWAHVLSTMHRTRGAFGVGTLYKLATDAGWQPSAEQRSRGVVRLPVSPDEFEVIEGTVVSSTEIAVAGAPAIQLAPREVLPDLGLKYGTGQYKGQPKATMDNVTKALSSPEWCGYQVRFDRFRWEVMVAPAGTEQWRPVRDVDISEIRKILDMRGFVSVGKDLARDALAFVAEKSSFDSAMHWLDRQTWDGTPRVEAFLREYYGCEDTPYTRAVSRYLWTALAGRVLEPGCQADMALILVSPEQGTKKSTGIKTLVPHATEQYVEIDLGKIDCDDTARRLRGRLIGELGELKGLNRQDLNTVKSWITRTHEDYIDKFQTFATKFPRRCIFIGTTNHTDFLADETGNRRWLPVRIGEGDRDAIRRDHGQLWAEGAAIFSQSGIAWQDAERLAEAEHAQYMQGDSWIDEIGDWLEKPDMVDFRADDRPRKESPFTIADVMTGPLGFKPGQAKRADEMRAAGALKRLGYESVKRRLNGKPANVWELKEVDDLS
jgi:hypothetical protein